MYTSLHKLLHSTYEPTDRIIPCIQNFLLLTFFKVKIKGQLPFSNLSNCYLYTQHISKKTLPSEKLN